MSYEIELKFPIHDPVAIRQLLTDQGGEYLGRQHQRDSYWNHPSRNFAVTDEAFRIRQIGDHNCLTYKGALLDTLTKSRKEIEVSFAEGQEEYNRMESLIQHLGFQHVGFVEKSREEYEIVYLHHQLHAVIDCISELGWFLELEMMAEEENQDEIRQALLEFAKQLGLPEQSERRSYLRMILEKSESHE